MDLDGNGLQSAGEPGIAGVTVTLTYPDGTTETITTNGIGNYLFSGLEEGNYTVEVGEGPANATLTTTDSFNVDLGEGENYLIADFGFEPANGNIGDRVWSDLDGDGIQDAGEVGIPGVTVTLIHPDGFTETMTTGGNGIYLFTDLPAGEYVVEVGSGPNGSTLTTTDSYTVDLDSGEDYLLADFGFEPAPEFGSIGDFVWSDLNGDGAFSPGEPGIGSIAVTITYPDGTTETQMTLNDGSYLFEGLEGGFYEVVVGEGPEGTTLSTTGEYTVNFERRRKLPFC